MASTVADFSRKLELTAKAIGAAQRPSLEEAATRFKVGIERQFAADGLRKGGRLAGTPWKGVRWDWKGDEIAVRALPPAHLFNNATSRHFITSRYAGGSRASRARRLGGRAGRVVRGLELVMADGSTQTVSSGQFRDAIGASRRGRLGRRYDLSQYGIVSARRVRSSETSDIGEGPVRPGALGARSRRANIRLGGNWRHYARHGGTSGTGSFGKGRDKTRTSAAESYMEVTLRDALKAFR